MRRASEMCVSLVCSLALGPAWFREARAQAPATDAAGVELEVRVDPKISGADQIVSWVSEDARKALAERPKRERRGTVRVGIAGDLYDYEVTITALRGEQSVGSPRSWHCECSNDDLLARLRTDLPVVADQLIMPEAAPAAPPKPRVVHEADRVEREDEEPTRSRAKLGPVGGAGVALMTVGAAGIATGAAFMVLGEQRTRRDSPTGDNDVQDYRSPGIAVLAGGAGLTLTGFVLVLLRERARPGRAESRRIAPSITTGQQLGLAAVGRF